MDGHPAGGRVVVFLRVNRPFKSPRFGMQGKRLPPHKAEDSTQGIETDNKIADKFQEPGGGFREFLICELLHELHGYHLNPMITWKFAFVKKKLMLIIKNLMKQGGGIANGCHRRPVLGIPWPDKREVSTIFLSKTIRAVVRDREY